MTQLSVEEMESTHLNTLHRVTLLWDSGGYLSTLDPQFHRVLQHMVLHYGPPDRVEFRLNHEGWER